MTLGHAVQTSCAPCTISRACGTPWQRHTVPGRLFHRAACTPTLPSPPTRPPRRIGGSATSLRSTKAWPGSSAWRTKSGARLLAGTRGCEFASECWRRRPWCALAGWITRTSRLNRSGFPFLAHASFISGHRASVPRGRFMTWLTNALSPKPGRELCRKAGLASARCASSMLMDDRC